MSFLQTELQKHLSLIARPNEPTPELLTEYILHLLLLIYKEQPTQYALSLLSTPIKQATSPLVPHASVTIFEYDDTQVIQGRSSKWCSCDFHNSCMLGGDFVACAHVLAVDLLKYLPVNEIQVFNGHLEWMQMMSVATKDELRELLNS